MKKWVVLAVFSLFLTVALSLMEIEQTARKKVIYIRGGEPVLADSVNQSDQFVFYEDGEQNGMFMKDDVTSVGSVQVQKKISWLSIIDRNKHQLFTDLGVNKKINRAADTRVLLFLTIFASVSGILKMAFVLASVLKNKIRAFRAEPPSPSATDKSAVFAQDEEETSEYRDIILFFLDIFRIQNDLDQDAPSRFSSQPSSAMSKRKVFELSVKGNSDWLNRRMSIAPLGEDSGSKSKCYYVIYDTHMVVKIPPTPVTDFAKYIRDIRREVQITAQLAPVACIIPMVSVILKKVKELPFAASLTQEQLEKRYIRLVEENPDYQNYLKIGDQFAFFMELTTNFFLGSVINELHKSKENIGDELRESPEVAWNQGAFTARYGLEALPVFDNLQALYRLCEAETVRIAGEAGQGLSIQQFHIKHWFLNCITGEKLQPMEKEVDADLLERINNGFSAIFKSNLERVDSLVGLLKSQLASKTFLKNRQQIENIASNMLVLLGQLKEKQIALRDLKPDNLFLDADPDNYPVFLNQLSSFSIGVIDAETAVSMRPMANGNIPQPLIGGTPLYATPLHLLKNQTISSTFGNLADALHFQDWFATIAIIFRAITGANLFPRAARTFPALIKRLKSSKDRTAPDEATVKAMSKTFWSAAAIDVKKQMANYADALNQLTVWVPETMAASIKAELEREDRCLKQATLKHITMSPLLRSQKNRDFLINASSDDILKQIDRWQNASHLPEQHRQWAPQMVSFLKNLNRLKNGQRQKQHAIAMVGEPPFKLSAYSLLEAMFQIAFRAMYKSRWNALTPPPKNEKEKALKDDRSLVTTILNQN